MAATATRTTPVREPHPAVGATETGTVVTAATVKAGQVVGRHETELGGGACGAPQGRSAAIASWYLAAISPCRDTHPESVLPVLPVLRR